MTDCFDKSQNLETDLDWIIRFSLHKVIVKKEKLDKIINLKITKPIRVLVRFVDLKDDKTIFTVYMQTWLNKKFEHHC
jgi:hypothetical protein